MQYVWGHPPGAYIDDILMRRETTTVSSPDPTTDFTTERYYCTDEQYSPVAILDGSADVVERMTYDAYGRARQMPGEDVDGDGSVALSDLNAVIGNWGNYGLADIDRSGTVALSDQLAVIGAWGAGGHDLGELSDPGEDNIIGFSGYLFNKETRHYHVRFRVYDTGLGRWLERDPLRYVDGMNDLSPWN